MKGKFAVLTLAAGLSGCGSLPGQSDVAAVERGDLEGCLYASVLYSPGSIKLSERAVNDGGRIRTEADPKGILMTCVEDRDIPDGYRWQVPALTAR